MYTPMQLLQSEQAYFATAVSYSPKMLMKLIIHEHFTCIHNSRGKISLVNLQTLHGIMHARGDLAYPALAVSYVHKMFMKLMPALHNSLLLQSRHQLVDVNVVDTRRFQ